VDGDVIFWKNRLSTHATRRLPMLHDRLNRRPPTAIQGHDDAITASLELSTKTWLVTSHSPGGEKLSKHSLDAKDVPKLLGLLGRLRANAEARLGRPMRIITVQEAGLDGFWLHRVLESEGIESYIVDAASIPVPRRKRRAKSDRIDGDTLWRALAAWLRGEPRVCSMVRPLSVEEEDRRRVVREYDALVRERTRETNRIAGLLAAQGIRGYNPLRRDRWRELEKLVTGDGRPLSSQLKRELARVLKRIETLKQQIAEVEAERDNLLGREEPDAIAAQLFRVKCIGEKTAATLALEVFFRRFENRRQLASFSGLAATPWRSGTVEKEQGISKAGSPRLRRAMIELAWLWLLHQRQSALSQWFFQRVREKGGRKRDRGIFIVALARKLLVALWRYVTTGEIPEGAVLKAA
jgi:transposase